MCSNLVCFVLFNQVEECHDRYIVMGDQYKELRETIVTTVLNVDGDHLQQLLQVRLPSYLLFFSSTGQRPAELLLSPCVCPSVRPSVCHTLYLPE